MFFDKNIKASEKFLGDESVELKIIDLNCKTISNRKSKYGKSQEWLSDWACHEFR